MSFKYLFGPVPSRRLGISLGVDFIPYKTCSLDCIYCESGPTTDLTIERKEFYSAHLVIEELDSYLKTAPKLDYVTFSGAGEPTLFSKIGEVIAFLKREYPMYKIALITNATAFTTKELFDEVMSTDLIVPSIDAADQSTFQKINRPEASLNIIEILQHFYEFSKIYKGEIWLEVFIVKGVNDSFETLKEIKKWIEKIDPAKIQINSLDRPGAVAGLKKADIDTLLKVKTFFGKKSEIVVRRNSRSELNTLSQTSEESILKNIKIRPMTLNDLISVTGVSKSDLLEIISVMESEGLISTNMIGENLFYKVVG